MENCLFLKDHQPCLVAFSVKLIPKYCTANRQCFISLLPLDRACPSSKPNLQISAAFHFISFHFQGSVFLTHVSPLLMRAHRWTQIPSLAIFCFPAITLCYFHSVCEENSVQILEWRGNSINAAEKCNVWNNPLKLQLCGFAVSSGSAHQTRSAPNVPQVQREPWISQQKRECKQKCSVTPFKSECIIFYWKLFPC